MQWQTTTKPKQKPTLQDGHPMPLQKKRAFSRSATPIERIFRKAMGRKMNEQEQKILPPTRRKRAASL